MVEVWKLNQHGVWIWNGHMNEELVFSNIAFRWGVNYHLKKSIQDFKRVKLCISQLQKTILHYLVFSKLKSKQYHNP